MKIDRSLHPEIRRKHDKGSSYAEIVAWLKKVHKIEVTFQGVARIVKKMEAEFPPEEPTLSLEDEERLTVLRRIAGKAALLCDRDVTAKNVDLVMKAEAAYWKAKESLKRESPNADVGGLDTLEEILDASEEQPG